VVRRYLLRVLYLAVGLALMACSAAAPRPVAPATTTASTARPSVSASASSTATPTDRPVAVTKVLVFIEENHSLAQMKAAMPYTFSLAQTYGYATDYAAIRHPSEPNYIAIAGGQTYGITDDHDPTANPVSGTSVFGQALAAGKTAGLYADGMPSNCATSDGGDRYAVKHNPWAYYTAERDACRRFDVPLDQLSAAITDGALPNVGMVVPNLCHDAHDCSLRIADTWFQGWMTTVMAGPDWKSGHLAVVLTADEDDRSSGNRVLTVVASPSLHATVASTPLTHYSMSRLLSEVVGASPLFEAASAPSMSTAFGLPLP
jgi:hypothetical protein